MIIETKYSVGDNVFVASNSPYQCQKHRIISISTFTNSSGTEIISYAIKHRNNIFSYREEDVFPTEQEFVKSIKGN